MHFTDLHNHLIPDVDDGAGDVEQALKGVRALRAEGVRTICATPHFLGSATTDSRAREARLSALDEGWAVLHRAARSEVPDIALVRGVELMLDVPTPDASDERLRLGGTRFVLVEFPFLMVPPHAGQALADLRRRGWVPVLAHPERYTGASVDRAGSWRDSGAYLQLNAGSLGGRYGKTAQDLATRLLERGLVDYIASDYHARGAPLLRQCAEQLDAWQAGESVQLLLDTNPARLLRGDFPLPVPAVRIPGGVLRRLRRALGLGADRPRGR